MSGRLDGRVAIIVGAGQQTGATTGNGRATSIRFAREGARLLLVDRDEQALAEVADDVRQLGAEPATLAVDIREDAAPTAIMTTCRDAFGRIDVLHNNVGVGAGDAAPTSTDRRGVRPDHGRQPALALASVP